MLVAGLITGDPESPTAKIVDAMLDGSLIYLLSQELLNDYRAVLLRPAIAGRHGLPEPEIERLLTEITANAAWRNPSPDSDHAPPDQQDSHLWALLTSEPSAVLVTGDRLLIENPRPRRSVITPAAWVNGVGPCQSSRIKTN